MRLSGRLAVLAWAFALGAAALLACGTDAEGIDACRTLENARCDRAPGCDVSLTNPPHQGSPDDDVDACKRYYDTACLHGLPSKKDPGDLKVEACRQAIQAGSCDVVKDPGIDPACDFLIPATVVDAGTDAATDASDASSIDDLGDASPF